MKAKKTPLTIDSNPYLSTKELIKQFKKDICIDFMYWLIEEKYCLKNPVNDVVDEFIK